MSKKKAPVLFGVLVILFLVATVVLKEPDQDFVEVSQATIDEPETGYSVIKVADGDTLTIENNGEKETIRVIGINTPETVDPRKPVECFGQEASTKAHELLDGASVNVTIDQSQGEKDKYGRTLAYVTLPDGTDFGKYMIENGYAYEYTYEKPYERQAAYKAAEADAKLHERGLWGEACE